MTQEPRGAPSDRELVVVKVFAHPRERVFGAWLNPVALAQWYGPDGFTVETLDADIRIGGLWRFDMVGRFEGQVQRFPSLMRFIEIVPHERIVVDYGSPEPDDPHRFRMTITFDAQADGKTVLTLRQLHPSRERRHEVMAFGAVEYGLQTLDSLAAWLAR
ncbi:MAG: SRPBCC domain-containing protein [Sphingobium sp.]|uniref:SRPBCC domain-containing protein n=1 Tax=Sphingobium sp. TaxID=1912891 RepID=UPI003BAE8178